MAEIVPASSYHQSLTFQMEAGMLAVNAGHRSLILFWLLWPLGLQACADDRLPAEADSARIALEEAFRNDVLPILETNCFSCHSHQAEDAEAGLMLDSRSGWEVGGVSGPAVMPGQPDESLLMSAIRHQGLEMPPGGKLTDEEIATIEQWIRDGAHDPRISESATTLGSIDLAAGRQHWAFQPIAAISPPVVVDTTWPLNEIDHFLLSKLEAEGLHPVGDADRYTWLRRVSFDLTGVPPTPADIEAFLSDDSPEAYARVVDRLLAAPAFGERWARHWLDLVGYADQIGTSNAVFAQHAWRYRDYVIDAFNDDKPFDRFIREQIAGDLLPYETVAERQSNLTATGFLVLGDIEIVEADKEKLLVDIVDQQLTKVGTAFLGMTLGCARCHDHKFDPISANDYYAMAGFFHNTSSVYKTDRGVWSDVHTIELPETDEEQAEREADALSQAEQIALWRSECKQAQTRMAELEAQLTDESLEESARQELTRRRDEQQQIINRVNRDLPHAEYFAPSPPRVYGVIEVELPQNMRITYRGNPRALGAAVPRGFLSVISEETPEIPPTESGRLQLADWIASAEHPLTARVTVNRIWQKLFGEGLVRTVDYFGIPGDRPSHPELLDYLARRFADNGWSTKAIIREIVLSRAYRLSSAQDEANHQIDPDNRLLWRMNRVRLDAEAIRDAMIFASGRLQSTGGPAMPLEFPENVGGLSPTDVNPPHFRLTRWRANQELERTIYLPVIRSSSQPGPAELRNVFDFPQPSTFTGRRVTTAVPTQALFLMNSPIVTSHASALAEWLTTQCPAEPERLAMLWLTLLNRPITTAERNSTEQFLTDAGENAWTELCHALLASNEFLMRL